MRRIKEYLNSSKLKMNYSDNKLNIVNYDEIVLLTEEKIILLKDKKQIIIKGSSLTLLKILDDEVLINGSIKIIEL